MLLRLVCALLAFAAASGARISAAGATKTIQNTNSTAEDIKERFFAVMPELADRVFWRISKMPSPKVFTLNAVVDNLIELPIDRVSWIDYLGWTQFYHPKGNLRQFTPVLSPPPDDATQSDKDKAHAADVRKTSSAEGIYIVAGPTLKYTYTLWKIGDKSNLMLNNIWALLSKSSYIDSHPERLVPAVKRFLCGLENFFGENPCYHGDNIDVCMDDCAAATATENGKPVAGRSVVYAPPNLLVNCHELPAMCGKNKLCCRHPGVLWNFHQPWYDHGCGWGGCIGYHCCIDA